MINKMKKQSHIKGCIMKIGILGMLILAGIGFYSCDDITKGYLETDEAGYVTDTLLDCRRSRQRGYDTLSIGEDTGGDRYFPYTL